MHAAAHGMPREGEHGVGELDLGFGERVGIHAGLDLRHRIFARIEAIGIDAGQIGRRRLGAVAHRAVGNPERREVAARVERLDGGALLLAAEDAVELAGGQLIAKLLDNRGVANRSGGELGAVGRRHRMGDLGRGRRRRCGRSRCVGCGRSHIPDARRRQVGAFRHRHGRRDLGVGGGKSAAGIRRERQSQGNRRPRQQVFEPRTCHRTYSPKSPDRCRGHGCCRIGKGKYQDCGFIDTGRAAATGAILLVFLWNSPSGRTNSAGVASPHHRRRRRRYPGPVYCTDGIIFAAGTSWPSRLGGQGMAMNQSKAT